jgi:hypothetical protein
VVSDQGLQRNREEGRGWGFGGGNWGRWSRPQRSLGPLPAPSAYTQRWPSLRIGSAGLIRVGLWVLLSRASDWRLRVQSDPSGRSRLLYVSIHRIEHQIPFRLMTTRSQNWGKRSHLTSGVLVERPTHSRSPPSSPVRSLDSARSPIRTLSAHEHSLLMHCTYYILISLHYDSRQTASCAPPFS